MWSARDQQSSNVRSRKLFNDQGQKEVFECKNVFPTVHRAGATPVPIPNTEVKPRFGDGTAGFPGGRVARRWDFLERRWFQMLEPAPFLYPVPNHCLLTGGYCLGLLGSRRCFVMVILPKRMFSFDPRSRPCARSSSLAPKGLCSFYKFQFLGWRGVVLA